MLILLYAQDKKAYLGFVPNNQTAFVDRLRKVIQQKQGLRQGAAGNPGMQGSMPQPSPQGNMPTQPGQNPVCNIHIQFASFTIRSRLSNYYIGNENESDGWWTFRSYAKFR